MDNSKFIRIKKMFIIFICLSISTMILGAVALLRGDTGADNNLGFTIVQISFFCFSLSVVALVFLSSFLYSYAKKTDTDKSILLSNNTIIHSGLKHSVIQQILSQEMTDDLLRWAVEAGINPHADYSLIDIVFDDERLSNMKADEIEGIKTALINAASAAFSENWSYYLCRYNDAVPSNVLLLSPISRKSHEHSTLYSNLVSAFLAEASQEAGGTFSAVYYPGHATIYQIYPFFNVLHEHTRSLMFHRPATVITCTETRDSVLIDSQMSDVYILCDKYSKLILEHEFSSARGRYLSLLKSYSGSHRIYISVYSSIILSIRYASLLILGNDTSFLNEMATPFGETCYRNRTVEEFEADIINYIRLLEDKYYSNRNQRNDNRVKSAIEIIAQNYSSPDFSVQQLADSMGLSASYITSLFREYNGSTPHSAIISYRIEKAKQLLEGTKTSIHDIAVSVGYLNDNYFYRLFKKETGYTPNQYREASIIENGRHNNESI